MTQVARQIVYVDMDHVLCDYDAGFKVYQEKFADLIYPQSQPGLYVGLSPIKGAIDAYKWFEQHHYLEPFILTAPSVRNPHCYSEKRLWVEKHLGFNAVRNLIISPHKHLNIGGYLIDDCDSGKGQDKFSGKLIHFGSEIYPDWQSVIRFFEGIEFS